MSDNLVLVFEPAAPPLSALIPMLSGFGAIDLQEGGTGADQLVVYDHGSHVFIQRYVPEEMAAEHFFDDWSVELVPARASSLVIATREFDLVKRVTLALARHFQFWVDTDFGEVYDSAKFVRRCAEEPGWDWRRWPAERTTDPLVLHAP